MDITRGEPMTFEAASIGGSQAFLSALFECTEDFIWVVDAEHFRLLACNSAFRRHVIQSYGVEPKLGLEIEDMRPLSLVPVWREFFLRALRDGPFIEEYETASRSHTLLLSFNVVKEQGAIIGVSVFGKDITARRRAEHALLSADERLSKLMRSSPWMISLTTLKGGIILVVNDSFANLLGYSREELLGRSTLDIGLWVDPDHRAELRKTLSSRGPIDSTPVRWRTRSGQELVFNFSAELVEFEGQDCIFASAADITDRLSAERALRVSEARYRTLVDYAPDAIVVIDVEDNYRFVDVNENACRLFEYDRDELLKLSPLHISPKMQPGDILSSELATSRIDAAMRGDNPVFEWTHLTSSGKVIVCEVRLVLLPSSEKTLVRGSVIDITERKRLEQQAAEFQARLNQAQRLEAIGTLAGGIAHDFNNILNAILGCLDLALMDLPEDSVVREPLSDLERAANRATALVRQILAFSRHSSQVKQPVDLSRIVKEVAKLLRATLPTTIAIQVRTDISVCVLADPGQLHQVLMNLGTNAGLAMSAKGGTLEIEITEHVSQDKGSPSQGSEPATGRYVHLKVKDTGCGIPEEHRERIFDPFFTTRAKGQGTGLGLSVVHGIIKEVGGTISVTSRVGVGTAFDILLPACEQQTTSAIESIQPQRGSECVLYVDDELDLTDIARRGLAPLGYRVKAFNDPNQAIEAFGAAPESFDILITDMTMPGLTGDVLIRRIRQIRKSIPVILVSGFSDRLSPEQAARAGADEFIEKPVRATALSQAIRRLCDRQRFGH